MAGSGPFLLLKKICFFVNLDIEQKFPGDGKIRKKMVDASEILQIHQLRGWWLKSHCLQGFTTIQAVVNRLGISEPVKPC